MTISMPRLEEGRVYHREEVAQYIGAQTGTSDFDVAVSHFPRDLQTWNCDLGGWRDREEVLLRYEVFPIEDFRDQIQSLENAFLQSETELLRVTAIKKVLLKEVFFPVILQQNDPQLRIIEGQHRAVALGRLNGYCLPAFLMGYRNWFAEDELLSGFEKEDEIVSVTLREVFAFFRHATCIDHRGIELQLFDSDRLRECDDVLAAKFRGHIIAAVTMTLKKGRPMLQTAYTLKQYRRKGVAYRLIERAIMRFKEAGVTEVLCDARSPGMDATLKRLVRERSELGALVRRVPHCSSFKDDTMLPADDLIEHMKPDVIASVKRRCASRNFIVTMKELESRFAECLDGLLDVWAGSWLDLPVNREEAVEMCGDDEDAIEEYAKEQTIGNIYENGQSYLIDAIYRSLVSGRT